MEQLTVARPSENTFSLPRRVQRAESETGELLAAGKRVLVIDDSPTIRAVVELALRCEGYITRSFPDGVEAMKWLIRPGSWAPDLVIVDIGLPKMDGYEVMRHFKANPRLVNTACIMLSARDGTVDQLKGKLVGAQMYLTKPCPVQVLCRAVRACLTADQQPGKKAHHPAHYEAS